MALFSQEEIEQFFKDLELETEEARKKYSFENILNLEKEKNQEVIISESSNSIEDSKENA